MNLPDNIIKHYLKNVCFISGSACGGKSTISKYLSRKHNIVLYNWDEKHSQHKAISDPRHQPSMNKKYGSWEEYFNRPPSEYSESIRRSIHEQVEIAIVELISMENDRIIVDGMFPCHVLKRISSYNRAVFLVAGMDQIRNDFLNRADKADMLRCLNSLDNPQQSIENMFLSIEHSLARDIDEIKASGFKWFMRGQKTDWDKIREAVERQFELIE
jgi:cytidylate kinase